MSDYNNMSFGELWQIFSEKYEAAMEQEMNQIVPMEKNTLSARSDLIRNLIRFKYFHKFQREMGLVSTQYSRFPRMIKDYPVDVDDMTLEDYQKILHFREWGKFERMEFIIQNPWMKKIIIIYAKEDKVYYSRSGTRLQNIEDMESTVTVDVFGKRFQKITAGWRSKLRVPDELKPEKDRNSNEEKPDETKWSVEYWARYTKHKIQGTTDDYPDNWDEFRELIESVTGEI